MKKLLLPLFTLFISTMSNAQAKVSWGEEFKMRKGGVDLAILGTDKTGIYLEESKPELKSYFVIGYTVRKSATLIKMNTAMAEQYRNDYDKELKGKEYDRFVFIQDKLYLFATSYTKKENSLYLYAAEVDKGSGNLKGDWQQVAAWEKLDKSEGIDFNISPNSDSSKLVLTTTFTGKSQNRYQVRMMDAGLKPVGNAATITNEYDPNTFQVQDFVYTSSGDIALVGRIYAYEEGKKKKDKYLVFKKYSIRIYNGAGQMKKELVTDIDGKYLVSGKLVQVKNELVLAAFYSNDQKKTEVNGMVIQRIDAATGKVLVSAKKELTGSMVSEVEGADGKPVKKNDDEAGLDANLMFRKFYIAPDNGLVILAEQYTRQVKEANVYTGGVWITGRFLVFDCGNLYMSKLSAKGDIEWLHVLPKKQHESVQTGKSNTGSMGVAQTAVESFWEGTNSMPYYGGFGSIASKNTIAIFFNDNEKNAGVLQPGTKIKEMETWENSVCYQLTLDMLTGQYTRKPFYSNKTSGAASPREGLVVNNSMYLIGRGLSFFRKPIISVGTITVN